MIYLCRCHDVAAEKFPVRAQPDFMSKAKDWSKIGLGKFRFSVTNRKAPVYRKKDR